MKKSLLALAVLGAFAGAAQAQSSVTIYGIVDSGVVYTTKAVNAAGTGTGSKFGVNSGVLQSSRLGFKGTEDLGGGMNALFVLESGFKNDTGALDDSKTTNTLFRRKSLVGLSGNFGSVLLGRNTDYADVISSYTSVGDFFGVTGAVGHNLDRLEGSRSNNSVTYTTNSIAGFTGNLMYGFGEQAGQTSAGQAFNIGGKYDNGPLGLGINYYQSKQGSTPADTNLLVGTSGLGDPTQAGNTAFKVLTLAASYQFGPARVYGNYSRVKQDLNTASPTALGSKTLSAANKADIYEIGTAYSLTPSLKLMGAVTHTRADFNSSAKGKLTQFSLGTDYYMSKRTDLYAIVANIRASDMANTGVFGDAVGNNTIGGADGSQTAVAVGIRHKF
ncbi:porin [Herbaspirillum sp. WKF16]|uniref:porin n=1 Tax=Herbaspirillum sp. WKF16 TaxID=3028312 RepID=UPI0023A9B480|nr:porin [Herbaspirillum sp. WKF16]WDZ95804.1 porin [Herbaspirillum sp. WKF16]